MNSCCCEENYILDMEILILCIYVIGWEQLSRRLYIVLYGATADSFEMIENHIFIPVRHIILRPANIQSLYETKHLVFL